MGITSSQPSTQTVTIPDNSQLLSRPQDLYQEGAVNMESPPPESPTVETPATSKSKAGKLKTYAKQRASSATKPVRSSARIRMASEELADQPTPARPAIPTTIEETPTQAKPAKRGRKRKADNTQATADQIMDDATPEQPAGTRKRRSKKQQQGEAQEAQPDDQLEVEVPETQDEPRMEPAEEHPEEVHQERDEVVESEVEAEAEAEAGAGAAASEELDQDAEGDVSQFDVPESDKDEEQLQPSSTKPKATKRKRQTSDNESPAPSGKRQKKASGPRKSNVPDYPEQGPFTSTEAGLIDAHLTQFCHLNGWTREQLVTHIQNSEREMSKVYVELANEVLPNRNRRAVQRYCRRHYNNYQRGRWSDEQDEMLRTAFAENPNKWVMIGARVGRMPEDCRDRWRNHVSLDSRHTDVWTQDEEQRLATAVRECLAAVEEKLQVALTRENEDDYIAWPVVVTKMNGSRNRLQCSMKWRKIKQRVEREEQAQREREELIAQGKAPPPGDDDDDDAMTSPQTATRWKNEARRRFNEMTMGDMLDITKETLYGAQMGAFASKNTFWAVVTRLHGGSPWTTADRKQVYRRLKLNIVDTGDFRQNLEEQVRWLESSFDAEALAERSKPKNRPSYGNRRSNGSTFRSEERVHESDEEDNTAAQQYDVAIHDAKLYLPETNGHDHMPEEEMEEVPQSPHISESEVDQEDYQ